MPESIEGTIVPQELITVDQLPVITERLATLSQDIDAKVAAARAMPVTNDTIQDVKKMRAALNADHKEMEERRKFVKRSVLSPYEEFEAAYRRCVSDKYKSADEDLKSAIDGIESAVKAKKAEEVTAYFNEYAASRHVDFLTWEKTGIKVNLSTSVKSLKDDAKAFIDHICDGLELIDTQEHKEEILVEFHKTLNAAQAVKAVTDRHRAIEAQKARQAELAAMKAAETEAAKRVEVAAPVVPPPIAPPVVIEPEDQDPVKTLAFKVTAPLLKLKALKRFLDDGGYQYE